MVTENIASAEAVLDKALATAFRKYEGSSDGGREGIRQALAGILRFVRAVAPNCGRRYLRLHMILIAALVDLDRGVVAPLFKRNSSGRADDSSAHRHIRARAAATIAGLMDIGLPRVDAATEVAKTLRLDGFKATNRAALKWYDELLSADLKRTRRPAKSARQPRRNDSEGLYLAGIQVLIFDLKRKGSDQLQIRDILLSELSFITRLWHPAPARRRSIASSAAR